MKSYYKFFSVMFILWIITPILLAQQQKEGRPGAGSDSDDRIMITDITRTYAVQDVENPEGTELQLSFEEQLEWFIRNQQQPLTYAHSEAFLLGDIIWQRLAGEKEYFLSPAITDFDAYYSRIQALDDKAQGIMKSRFALIKLQLNNTVKNLLTDMSILVPDYYERNEILVYLPEIDIDRLVDDEPGLEFMNDYGKQPGTIKGEDGTRSTLYAEGWEGSTAPYTFTGGNTQWGKVSCQAYAGTWTMWCAGGGNAPQPQCTNYANNQNTSVYKTTGVNVSGYVNVVQSYYYKYNTELNWDYFKTYWSTNGTSWNLHHNWTGSSAAYPSYNHWSNGFNNFSTIYYKFEFTSDATVNNYGGVYIDNLLITGDAGCNSTAQWGGLRTPTSNWQFVNGMFGGEYALFEVVSGTNYHWSLCPIYCGYAPYDSELTLRRADNGQIIAYSNDFCSDDAQISWTANFTGNVKVVLTKYPCAVQSTSTRMAYKSGSLDNLTLTISPTGRTVGYSAGSTTFSVISNGSWTVSGWPAWVTSVSPTSGTGNATITVNYSANNTGGPQRYATINTSLPCSIDPIPFTLTQNSDPGCTSSTQYGGTYSPSANWKFVNGITAGKYALFAVTSGTTYQWSLCPEHGGYANYDSQLTLRTTGNTFLAYSDDACGNDARISWTADFTGNVKLIISQYYCTSNSSSTRLAYKSGALVLPNLSVSPTTRYVDPVGSSTTFSLTSNTTWSLSGWPSWITLVSPTSGSGNATITVYYNTNSASSSRTGTIAASAPGVSNVNFNVVQRAGCNSTAQYPSGTLVPVSYWKYQSAIYAGEYSRFSVVSGTSYRWSLCSEHGGNASYDSQLTLRRASDDLLLAYSDDYCGDDAMLAWTANFTGEVKVIVSQYNCGTNTTGTRLAYKTGTLVVPSLTITPGNRNVSSAAGSTTFTISSNTSWTVTNNASWMTNTPTSGGGNATITVNYDENQGSQRIGTLTASAYAVSSATATVTQAEPDCMTCPNYNFSIGPTVAWQIHSSSHVSYGCKFYRVSITSGRNYTFKTGCGNGATADYDTYLELYNANCELIASNDDGCENFRSKIEWTATYSGYAYLRVRGYQSNFGNYTLAYHYCTTAPSQPGTINGPTTVCTGSVNTYSVAAVSGATDYSWTLPSGWTGSSNTSSINATAGATGGSISVIANNACGSSPARTLAVAVITIPVQPGVINGPTTVCQGSVNTYSITAVPDATSYVWALPSGWTGSSTAPSINATAGASGGNITVAAVNACGTSAVRSLAVAVISLPGQPGPITGPTSVCQGTTHAYSIAPVSGATSYTWSLPAGWGGSSSSTVINATAGTTGGIISVTANNACGPSTARTLNVTVLTTPAQPGTITGPTTVCQGSNNTYSVAVVPGATVYNWSLPPGWGGSSTTNSINTTAGSSGGIISVTAGNICGTSLARTLTVNVISAPVQPGPITGPTSVISGNTYSYSITPVTGATSYNWAYTGGGTPVGSGTNITLTPTSSGTLSVIAVNVCGNSPARNLAITVTGIPATRNLQNITITSGPTICYDATQTITLAGGGTYFIVQNGGGVELVAGNNIVMLPGTQVQHGGYLHGRITTTGNYCMNYQSLLEANLLQPESVETNAANDGTPFFKVYPNPTTGLFTLELLDMEGIVSFNVEIYSMVGEKVLSANLPASDHYQFDLKKMPNGIYLIRVMKDDRIGVDKVIKQ